MSETKIQKSLHTNLGEVPLDEMVLDNVEEGFSINLLLIKAVKRLKMVIIYFLKHFYLVQLCQV